MVSPLAVAAIVFGCVFGGALVGMVLRDRLPKDHLGPETKDLVKLGVGLIGTMSALISAASVSAAIFLILELDQPFNGLIRISSGSLRSAIANLGR